MEKPATWENLHYVPIAIFISFPIIAVTTYAIAVGLGHTEAGFPYISDTATNPPESCIFAQFVNMIVALMCIFVYIRYIQVKECIVAFRGNVTLEKWNWVGLILGFLSSLGLSVLANFEETSVIVVHLIGAFTCFISGTIYFWVQAVCSYYLQPHGCSMPVVRARIIMAALMTICVVLTLVFGLLSYLSHADKEDRKWDVNDAGWDLRVTSTISEWLFALIFCSYVVSFTGEFKRTQLVGPTLIYKPDELTMSNQVLGVYQEEDPQRVVTIRRIESPTVSNERSSS